MAEKRDHLKETKSSYENGATRSELTLRYDLIPKAAFDGIARRLELGAQKHGERNWEGGGAEFVKATKNHLLGHVLAYIENGQPEDLDAIGANYAFLAHFRAKGIS
jgi:hypothetical protein